MPKSVSVSAPLLETGNAGEAGPLTVVVVSYNSGEAMTPLLERIAEAPGLRVLVVDNHSSDGTPEQVRARFPKVEVIDAGGNLGYGRAANIGLSRAMGDYALLLNPDLLASPEDIDRLLAHARRDSDDTAIWGPATRAKDHTGAPPRPVHWVSGSAMLFHLAKISRVGLFDENIFLFSEETDLCERTLAAGHGIVLCPDVFFDHKVGQATRPNPRIEYMKWWHFGWSQCYRITKNGHSTLFRNPLRKYLNYRLHSLIATSARKRRKWKAKADGAQAFLRGEKAFRADGSPQMS